MVISQSRKMSTRESRNTVLQQNRTKHTIKQSQLYMSELKEKLSSFEPFSNNVTPADCVDRLVAHRITSKFHVDDSTEAKRLQSEAFAKYIAYDNQLPTFVDTLANNTLEKARIYLYRAFKDFRVDFSDCGYSVTPGETYISNQGEVSILAKLFDITHWTVTANCLDDACVFIYNNISFKRAANRHLLNQVGVITRKERRALYLKFRHKADVGFHVFRHLLITHVLTIVDGARAASVPKSNDSRRFINIEAMFSVIIQRAIASEFLDHLAYMGNDLGNFKFSYNKDVTGLTTLNESSAQKYHGQLIKDSRYATIDFSNASDSVLVVAVMAMFPEHVANLLFRTRSHFVLIDDAFHEPKKLSSMGNGFTFEVMTALLYAIGRAFTSDVRVYGDDVIIPNEYALLFVRACKLIGFSVNEKKTFINSFFRESCGYYYSDHINDYIVSFDFGQILSLSDIIMTCNKLTCILLADQVSDELKASLQITRDKLNALVHASRKGPVPASDLYRRKFLALYVFDSKYKEKQKRSKELRSLRLHYIEKNGWHFTGCQIETSGVSLVYVPFFVPDKSRHAFASVDGLKVLLPALYSGKRLNATVRGKGKWVDLPAFIYDDGVITLISNLISSQSIWVDRLNGAVSGHERR